MDGWVTALRLKVPARTCSLSLSLSLSLTLMLCCLPSCIYDDALLPTTLPPSPEQQSVSRPREAMEDKGESEKEGYLVKRGGRWRSWKRRWFVLQNKTLYYYSNQTVRALYLLLPRIRSIDQSMLSLSAILVL
jgi:hypothetical protein